MQETTAMNHYTLTGIAKIFKMNASSQIQGKLLTKGIIRVLVVGIENGVTPLESGLALSSGTKHATPI